MIKMKIASPEKMRKYSRKLNDEKKKQKDKDLLLFLGRRGGGGIMGISIDSVAIFLAKKIRKENVV